MTDTPRSETETDTPNEILAAAKDAKIAAEAAAEALAKRAKNWPLAKIGLGVGIGSAAVAAAVLFANRQRDEDK
ncbi:MAG TPA: hypothetical protein VFQ57_08855 [Sphingomonas sp.]|jgi:hypothetical protein|nr:hypothetical protein [Sphingomonas sp.]